MTKKLFLVYKVYFFSDSENGSPEFPLWVCSTEELAQDCVDSLTYEFLESSKRLVLKYTERYFYRAISYYE